MKPKNIMLLGFVNKAVEYLQNHMDEEPDTRLAELKNIDLASLKEELNDNLDESLGTMQSTMSTLLKAGNEAFDQFVNGDYVKRTISDEFNKIFDVSFDEDRNKKQEELAKLLSFYNLENDFDEQEDSNFANDEYLEEIKKNVTNDDVQDITPIEHETISDEKAIDTIFNEIENNETDNIEPYTDIKKNDENNETDNIEPYTDIKKNDENNDELNSRISKPIAIVKTSGKDISEKSDNQYVSSLIEDLKRQLANEEKYKAKLEIKNKEVYDDITKMYPYIPKDFLREVYDLKNSIANEYPLNKKIIVLHRISFDNIDNLRRFVEIVLKHDYSINADEKKMIVDVFKEFENTDGRIITNIYEIANQGYLLNGQYEGYNVIVNEKE